MTIKKILLVGVLAAGLIACDNKSNEQTTNAVPSTDEVTTSTDLLARVPADTPYLFLNTKAIPEDLYDHFIEQNASMYTSLSGLMDNISAEIEADTETDAEAEAIIAMQSRLFEFFSGIESAQDLEDKTGLTINGQSMVYGAGVFPVAYLTVSDADKVNETIQSLLSQDGNTNSDIQTVNVDGTSVNKLAIAEDHLGVYWQVSGAHLIVSFLPVQMESSYMSNIFGDARPSNAASIDTFNAMNTQYGFNNYGSGYVDFVKLYDQLVSQDTPEGSALSNLLAEEGEDSFLKEPACINEARDLLNKGPRLYVGLTEFNQEKVGYRMVHELDSDLRTGLASIVGNAPISNDPKTPLNFGLNLNLAGLRDFISEETNKVFESPYTCSQLSGLNDLSASMNSGINQPMLPLLGNLNGLRFSLAEAGLGSSDPMAIAQNVKGHFVLYTDQPNMLIGLGQMTLPFLSELNLEPGGEPQALPADMIPIDMGDVFVATSDSAIGLSIGDQQQNNLPQFLNAAKDAQPALFSFGMDYKLYGDFFKLFEDFAPSDDTEEDESTRELMQQMSDIYSSLGYVYGNVSVNNDGLVVDQVMYPNN